MASLPLSGRGYGVRFPRCWPGNLELGARAMLRRPVNGATLEEHWSDETWRPVIGDLIFPRFGGQVDYAASAAVHAFNSNSIGLT